MDRDGGHARSAGAAHALRAVQLLGFGLLICGVCWASIEAPSRFGQATPIWPANAIVLSILLSTEHKSWPVWLAAAGLGNLAANFLTDLSPLPAVFLAICNVFDVGLAGLLLRRFIGERLDVAQSNHLFRFFLVALIAPILSALLATTVLGQIDSGRRVSTPLIWALTDGLGVIVVTPVLLTLYRWREVMRDLAIKPAAWASLAFVAAASAGVFVAQKPLGFLIPPVLLVAVFQLELVGAALGVLVVILTAVVCGAFGARPMSFMPISIGDRFLASQMFLAAITLTTFPTAAVLAQRRRSRMAQAESDARYRMVTETSRDLVLKYDRDGVIQFASRASLLMGHDPQSLVGANLFDLIHPDDADAVRARMAVLLSGAEEGGRSPGEFRLKTADGEHVWVEGNPSLIPGETAAFTDSLRDVATRRTMEAELRAARAAAERSAAVKGEFLANMTHELRTPLTGVLGFTSLALEQPDLTAATRGYIRRAANAGALLLATVNDILDFSALEFDQLKIRPEATDVASLCSETLSLVAEEAEAKGLKLKLEVGDLPPDLMLDPSRFSQILLHLVGNAIKFSDQGEITVEAGWRDERLDVSVRDQGPGVAAAQQSLLFREFSQIDGASTRRHEGAGLGLAISKGLITAMGGEIGVESEPGVGSRFFFALPAEQASAQPAASAPKASSPLSDMRVLVADDHAVNREFVRIVLRTLGMEIAEAATGAEAVELASVTPFDVILMDLRMPELDGYQATLAIRQGGGPNANAPILAFSAGADEPGAQARLEAGFDGDLAKPLRPDVLLEAVARYARQAD